MSNEIFSPSKKMNFSGQIFQDNTQTFSTRVCINSNQNLPCTWPNFGFSQQGHSAFDLKPEAGGSYLPRILIGSSGEKKFARRKYTSKIMINKSVTEKYEREKEDSGSIKLNYRRPQTLSPVLLFFTLALGSAEDQRHGRSLQLNNFIIFGFL